MARFVWTCTNTCDTCITICTHLCMHMCTHMCLDMCVDEERELDEDHNDGNVAKEPTQPR